MFITHRPRDRSHGPGTALGLPLLVTLAILATGCGGSTGDCVEVFQFEGTVRKGNYTRSECEDECNAIGRALQCFFDGSITAPFGPGRPLNAHASEVSS